jgi:hypothetical protein
VINVALYHCLGPSIQTALFNGPLVVIVAWAMGKPMDLNFEIFMVGLLVLSILVVGNFLRDGESNWLEGALLVVCHPPSSVNLRINADSFIRLYMLLSPLPAGTTLTLMSPLRTVWRRALGRW